MTEIEADVIEERERVNSDGGDMYESEKLLPQDPEGNRLRTATEILHEYAQRTVGRGAYVIALGSSSINANLNLTDDQRVDFYSAVDRAVGQVVSAIKEPHATKHPPIAE